MYLGGHGINIHVYVGDNNSLYAFLCSKLQIVIITWPENVPWCPFGFTHCHVILGTADVIVLCGHPRKMTKIASFVIVE